jgi:hypothetical protein
MLNSEQEQLTQSLASLAFLHTQCPLGFYAPDNKLSVACRGLGNMDSLWL